MALSSVPDSGPAPASSIELEAAAADAAAAAAPPPGAEHEPDPHIEREPPVREPEISTAQQLDAFLCMVLAGAKKKFPPLAELWTDDARGMFVAGLAPLLDKYDAAPSALFMRWKEEFMALVICVPLLWQTAAVLRAALEAARADAAKDVSPDAEPRAPG